MVYENLPRDIQNLKDEIQRMILENEPAVGERVIANTPGVIFHT